MLFGCFGVLVTGKQTDIALVIRVTFVDEKIEKPKVSPLEILPCSHTHNTPAQVKINKYFTDMILQFTFASLSNASDFALKQEKK